MLYQTGIEQVMSARGESIVILTRLSLAISLDYLEGGLAEEEGKIQCTLCRNSLLLVVSYLSCNNASKV